MTADPNPPRWINRRPAQWALPASLQPRAWRDCRIVRADTGQPVPLTRWGYRLRARAEYRLEFGLGQESAAAPLVSLSGVALPCLQTAQQSPAGGPSLPLRYAYAFPLGDGRRQRLRGWWSRLEERVVRVEYRDGRDDFQQTFSLLVAPRRGWGLALILLLGLAAGLGPWLTGLFAARSDLPFAAETLTMLSRPAVWQFAWGGVLSLWLLLLLGDQLQLRLHRARLRRTYRAEIQRRLAPIERTSQAG